MPFARMMLSKNKKMGIHNVLAKGVLRLTRKPIYASENTLRQHSGHARRKAQDAPAPSVQRTCQIERDFCQGVTCYTKRSLRRKGANAHVLYLHRGGYHEEMAPALWHSHSTLVNRSGVTATVLLSPLAPEHTHTDTYPWPLALIQRLCDALHPENLTIMGDSAGGGMALSLMQRAVAQGLPRPKQTLLLSPWLDHTLQTPAIRERDRSDPQLTSAGLLAAARWWAGGDDLTSPVLSRINGSLAGIGSLLLAVGTDELFHRDAHRLRERALAEGVDLESIEKEGVAHQFMLAPIPAAKPVTDRFVERLKHAPVCSS